MAKKMYSEKLEILDGLTASKEGNVLVINGPKGAVNKKLDNPRVELSVDNKEIVLTAKKSSKQDKAIIKTYKAHVLNAFKGCSEGFTYKLKICSGHFPMNVSVTDNVLTIKNFIGEKVPRQVRLIPGTEVKVEGSFITVSSNDKDKAGQTAANIEQATRRPGFDKRVFQDGIYIIEKSGKEV